MWSALPRRELDRVAHAELGPVSAVLSSMHAGSAVSEKLAASAVVEREQALGYIEAEQPQRPRHRAHRGEPAPGWHQVIHRGAPPRAPRRRHGLPVSEMNSDGGGWRTAATPGRQTPWRPLRPARDNGRSTDVCPGNGLGPLPPRLRPIPFASRSKRTIIPLAGTAPTGPSTDQAPAWMAVAAPNTVMITHNPQPVAAAHLGLTLTQFAQSDGPVGSRLACVSAGSRTRVSAIAPST